MYRDRRIQGKQADLKATDNVRSHATGSQISALVFGGCDGELDGGT